MPKACALNPDREQICVPEDGRRASYALASEEIHQFAESLGNAIDAKDRFTRQHSDEVAEVSHLLARRMGLPSQLADHIHIAGHLHDIGKIGVPDHILQKAGPLSDREWQAVKLHPVIGAEIIAPVLFLSSTGIVGMVYHHHESFNGQGYPAGLKGADIPLGARIIAVADSLSAMLQNRPYRRRMDFAEAVQKIAALSGAQYDPRVVEVLLDNTGIVAKAIDKLTAADPGPEEPGPMPGTANSNNKGYTQGD
jgi:HD-GYP domain-containing protein (c-di-GMP phosphodiesterase class II)